MIEITEDNYNQHCFWKKLVQIKFAINYFCFYIEKYIHILHAIKITSIILTALLTGLLMGFYNIVIIRYVCAVIIIIVPIFNVLSENLPYEKRAVELREISAEYNRIYIAMETDWRKIANGEIDYNNINLLINEYELKINEIDSHYFKNDALPFNEKIESKASNETEDYYKNI